jgi:hypothetical protein
LVLRLLHFGISVWVAVKSLTAVPVAVLVLVGGRLAVVPVMVALLLAVAVIKVKKKISFPAPMGRGGVFTTLLRYVFFEPVLSDRFYPS